jgi:two-component system sensor histidine kinase UhpB
MKRGLLAVIIVVIGVAGIFSLDQIYRNQVHRANDRLLLERINETGRHLESGIQIRILAAEQLRAFFLSTPDFPDEDTFNTYAMYSLEDFHYIRAFQYVDPGHIIRYIYPLEGNEAALNLDLMTRPAAPFVQKAIQTRQTTLNRPTVTVQGSLSVIARTPIFNGEKYHGLAQAVFDIHDLLHEISTELDNSFNIQIQDADGNVFWSEDILIPGSKSVNITAGDTQWVMTMNWNGGEAGPNIFIEILIWGLGCGLIGALVFGVNQTYKRIEKLSTRVEEKSAELAVSQANYQQLFENSHDAVFLIDSHGRILDANSTAINRYGYTLSELKTKTVVDLASPELIQQAPGYLDQALKQRMSFEWKHLKKDGSVIDVEIGTAPIQIEEDTLILSSVRDITERKRDQNTILQEREKAEMYLNLAPAISVSLDLEGKVTMVNDQGCRVLEAKREDILGKVWMDHFLPEAERESISQIFKQIVAGEVEPVEYVENEILTAKGNTRSIWWHNSTLTDPEGKVIGAIASGEDITERRRIIEALRTVEDRYQAVVETQTEFVTRLTPDGILTFANQAYCRHHNKTYDEVVGNSIWNFMPADEQQKVRDKFANLTPETPVLIDEHLQCAPDGSPIWHRWTDQGLFDENGQLLGIQSVGFNITENKIAQDYLQQSEERFRRALENIPDVVVLYDTDLRIQYINEATIQITGKSPIEFIGFRDDEIWPQEIYGPYLPALEKSLQTRTVQIVETDLGMADGLRSLRITCVPLLDADGNVREILGITHDFTKQKNSEQRLRESEFRYRQLLDSSPIGVVVHVDETVVFSNPAGAALFGAETPDKLIGKPISELIHPSHLQAARDRIRGLLAGDLGLYPIEDIYLRLDGSAVTVEVRAVPLTYEGKPAIQVMVSDITKRKKIELDLNTSRKQLRDLANYLQQALESERKYIAREIHDDFGQSLTGLKIDLFSLAKAVGDDQPEINFMVDGMINAVDASIDHMRNLSSQLRPGLLDDLGLVPALEWLVTEFTARSGLDHTLTLPEFAPDLPPDLVTDLYRICQESLTNVVRHSKASKVDVGLTFTEVDVVLHIRDNGRGIIDAEATKKGSLGLLGMSERVLNWGGEIIISGMQPVGTEVLVKIPLPHND